MKRIPKAHLAMLGVTLAFGLNYSIAKSMMPTYLTPYQMLFLRLAGGALLFWLFQPFIIKEQVKKRDLGLMALCGLFGLTLNMGLFYTGLNYTTPVDASVIHVSNPIMVLILSVFLLHEKITGKKVLGIFFGLSGALVIILWGKIASFGNQSTLGNILVTLNMFFYSLYLVVLKPLTNRYHPITLLKWISLFGFLFAIPLTSWSIVSLTFVNFDWYGWFSLGYIIIITTFLVYLLINYALKRLNPTTVSYYTYMQPVIAAITSVSLGMERITLPKVLAAVLIFGGVALVSQRGKKVIGGK
jgi:drug/metabolite transporter (DMT)-like permease